MEAHIKGEMKVLDFGCGSGGFSIAAAKLVEPKGLVYAVDINPLAINSIKRVSTEEGLNNIRACFVDDMGDIPKGEIDMVILYDVIHGLPEPKIILAELYMYSLLKTNGVLSVRDYHLKEDIILSKVMSSGLYSFAERNRLTYRFNKI